MKRFLLMALLMTNIHVTIHNGKFLFEFSGVSAQTMQYEMLEEVTVDGELMNCPFEECSKRDSKKNIEEHMKTCDYRIVECPRCHKTYTYQKGHICPSLYVECPICRSKVLQSDIDNGRHSHDAGNNNSNENHPPDEGGNGNSPPSSEGGGGNSPGTNSQKKLQETLIERLNEIGNITPVIQEKINQLWNDNVFTFDESVPNPQFNMKDGKIHVPADMTWIYAEAMSHEMIHYWQNELGMLDYENASSNNEIQAYFVNHVLFLCVNDTKFLPAEIDELPTSDWHKNGYFGRDAYGVIFYGDKLLAEINSANFTNKTETYYQNNRTMHGNDSSDSHSYAPDYDWKWIEILDKIGFTYRK